jgi:TonB-linked SusC/RagA family outer membrane protein
MERPPSHPTVWSVRSIAATVLIGNVVLAGDVTPAHAQSRLISGLTIDSATGEPLAGSLITVKGAPAIRAEAGVSGRFSLRAPSTDVTVIVRRIGYRAEEIPVPMSTDSVLVRMRRDPLRLDEVVVTGQASSMSRRHLANSVVSVGSDAIERIPVATIENALQGKVTGAQIQQNTGAPGGGNRILIRGTSSILGNSEPLYVIDGVLISNASIAPGTNPVTGAAGLGGFQAGIQEAPVNRVADLNPSDIETIEVLKGAAVAALYGSKASAGVIMITTKRGRGGAQQVSARSAIGTSRLAKKMGTRRYADLAAARAALDPNNTLGDSLWTAAYRPGVTFDYEELLFGEHPFNYESSVGLGGGSDNTKYFVSALLKRDEGILRNTFADRKSIRTNLDHTVGTRIRVSGGSQLTRNSSDRGILGNSNVPGGDNTIYINIAAIPNFYDLRQRADGTYPTNPWFNANPFQTADLVQNNEVTWRSISNARLNVDVLRRSRQQLTIIAQGGADIFTQRNDVYSPPTMQFEGADGLLGTASASQSQITQHNLNVNLLHVFQPAPWLSVSSQVGTQHEVAEFDQTRAVGRNLQGALTVPAAATSRDIFSDKSAVHDFGVFAQSEALLWDRLLLTAGMRADRSSNNGDIGRFYIFPKLASSYRVTSLPLVDAIKLRVAYGETGNRPEFGQKFTYLTPTIIGTERGVVLPARRGADEIFPERQRELEGGVDVEVLENRAQLELTGFQRNISNLIIERRLAPTSGYSSEVYNGASLRVRGFEGSINAFPIQSTARNGPTWNARVGFALNRDQITELPIAPFPLGTSVEAGAVWIAEGHSATQLIGADTVAVAGVCPARIVDASTCAGSQVGQVVHVFMGRGSPDYLATVGNDFQWMGLGIYALFERQKGGMLRSNTHGGFDIARNSRDYDAPSPDPTKPLGKYRADLSSRVTRVYYRDASYWKLRELSLNYDIPRSYARRLFHGAESARVILSGHNLKTWTKFPGSDPDFDNFGALPRGVQRNRELHPYPASRNFWLSVNVSM